MFDDIQSRFLLDFASRGFELRLITLHMPLGKRPVTAVDVFDQQNLDISVKPPVHDRAA